MAQFSPYDIPYYTELCPTFEGSPDGISVYKYFSKIEEIGEIAGWTHLLMKCIARSRLRGGAQDLVYTQPFFDEDCSYEVLKQRLMRYYKYTYRGKEGEYTTRKTSEVNRNISKQTKTKEANDSDYKGQVDLSKKSEESRKAEEPNEKNSTIINVENEVKAPEKDLDEIKPDCVLVKNVETVDEGLLSYDVRANAAEEPNEESSAIVDVEDEIKAQEKDLDEIKADCLLVKNVETVDEGSMSYDVIANVAEEPNEESSAIVDVENEVNAHEEVLDEIKAACVLVTNVETVEEGSMSYDVIANAAEELNEESSAVVNVENEVNAHEEVLDEIKAACVLVTNVETVDEGIMDYDMTGNDESKRQDKVIGTDINVDEENDKQNVQTSNCDDNGRPPSLEVLNVEKKDGKGSTVQETEVCCPLSTITSSITQNKRRKCHESYAEQQERNSQKKAKKNSKNTCRMHLGLSDIVKVKRKKKYTTPQRKLESDCRIQKPFPKFRRPNKLCRRSKSPKRKEQSWKFHDFKSRVLNLNTNNIASVMLEKIKYYSNAALRRRKKKKNVGSEANAKCV